MKTAILIILLAIIPSLASGKPGEYVHHASKNSISFIKYEKGRMFVRLQTAEGNPLKTKDLVITHTEPLHIFTISEDLSAYTHNHPRPERDAGIYSFEWKEYDPKKNYLVWADIVPASTKHQEFLNFKLGSNDSAEIDTSANLQNSIEGYKFSLSFNKTPKAGQDLIMKLNITPQPKLEPIMGELAHIVAFSGSNQEIIHVHPIEGGAQFHITFPKKGFTKIFAQIKIDGKEYFIPFGLTIQL